MMGWTNSLTDGDRTRLQQVLPHLPNGFLGTNMEESFPIIIDTGCSFPCSGFKADFLPGSITELDEVIPMTGIAGGIEIKRKGRLHYELLDDAGELQTIETDGYYMPELQCRLFSPQAYFKALKDEGKDPRERSGISVKARGCYPALQNGSRTSVQYDQRSALPTLSDQRMRLL